MGALWLYACEAKSVFCGVVDCWEGGGQVRHKFSVNIPPGHNTMGLTYKQTSNNFNFTSFALLDVLVLMQNVCNLFCKYPYVSYGIVKSFNVVDNFWDNNCLVKTNMAARGGGVYILISFPQIMFIPYTAAHPRVFKLYIHLE